MVTARQVTDCTGRVCHSLDLKGIAHLPKYAENKATESHYETRTQQSNLAFLLSSNEYGLLADHLIRLGYAAGAEVTYGHLSLRGRRTVIKRIKTPDGKKWDCRKGVISEASHA